VTRPFVDFYRDNAISPVSQDIGDIRRHFERRASLYRTMGIPSNFLSDRDVLEFGPGSGHNALYTASLGPRSYTLVDGNPYGLKEAEQLFATHVPGCNVRFVESLIEEYKGNPVDFVVCEGTIPFQRDPGALALRIASFVRPGGLITLTTVDAVSYLAESLRRLACECIIAPSASPQERLEVLRPLLTPHLSTLAAMSRPFDDWIWDNILQPMVPGTFSIPEAVEVLGNEFDFYGASPSFVTDWRWYKELYGAALDFNARAVAAYRRNIINFLDWRTGPLPPIDEGVGTEIIALSEKIVQIVLGHSVETAAQRSQTILPSLRLLRELVAPISPLSSAAIAEAVTMFESQSFEHFGDAGEFRSFFGRAQQHVTFVRRLSAALASTRSRLEAPQMGPRTERESDRWGGVKAQLGEEAITLGPYFTYIARKSPRRLLHLLSYYKFAAKMIGARKRVLEVGCSEGFGTVLLAENAESVLGVDLDADAIAVANSSVASAKLRFEVGDVLTGSLGVFDAAVTLDVIEHIFAEHESEFMARIAGSLGPDGVLIVGTPNITSDQFASAVTRRGHVNLFSAERLRELGLEHFHNVFMFSANDEVVHTGFSELAHYLIALCVGPRRAVPGEAGAGRT
jgi:2-polyprenyl-3-methyl-5-hydroxy-6-metoxy-1,4-benzoquinol methylase